MTNFIGILSGEGIVIVRRMKVEKVGNFLDDNPLIALGFNLGVCNSQEDANFKMAEKLAKRLYPLLENKKDKIDP